MITAKEFDAILDRHREELKIDKYSLEEECVIQPELYAKYCEYYAEAEKEVAQSKLERNKVEARLDKELRKNHIIHGFPKSPSVGETERWIKAHPDYIAAQSLRIEAQYRLNIIDGIKWSLQHRKASLEHLVNLFLNNYYSDIPVKGVKEVRERESTKFLEEQTKQLNESEGSQKLLMRRRQQNGI